ncbi:hypothetical protein PanWU01x14_168870 [Parasponia andersonii]|uniref:Uncharacterized protein n=1 Tax=Parasponia andersonii TaxID=3476 RepID=A0A2P5CAQ6_PARAD|nr:hypothetical protein PanWU01x14_168870 [Parasponia andersonii]
MANKIYFSNHGQLEKLKQMERDSNQQPSQVRFAITKKRKLSKLDISAMFLHLPPKKQLFWLFLQQNQQLSEPAPKKKKKKKKIPAMGHQREIIWAPVV